MAAEKRQLAVFFQAGQTRYAVDALRVLEVVRSEHEPLVTKGRWEERHLALLLGGEDEVARAAVVIDVTPTLALLVASVEGVFDRSGSARWPVQGRMIPLVAPVIAGTFLFEDRLVFELDVEGVTRGLPRQMKTLERHVRQSPSALVFSVEGERLGVPLHQVAHVLEPKGLFNRSPNAGTFLGVVMHRHHLCPVYTVGRPGVMLPFVVLFEARAGDLIGLTATAVEGVKSGSALEGLNVLDVERMFS